MKRTVYVYDAEKYDNTGNGSKPVSVTINKGDNFQAIKNKIQEEQKEINRVYRETNKPCRCPVCMLAKKDPKMSNLRGLCKEPEKLKEAMKQVLEGEDHPTTKEVLETEPTKEVFEAAKEVLEAKDVPKPILKTKSVGGRQGRTTTKTTIRTSSNINLKLDKGTGNTTCILGSSKKGKTTLLMKLYDKYYKKDITTLFSVNTQIYKKKGLIIKEPDSIKEVIDAQLDIQKGTDNHYKFCDMFDDVINLKKDIVNNLILTYRNSNISSIISLQYGFLLSKMIRANANNFIFFGFNSDEAIEDIIKLFFKSHFSKLGYKKLAEQVDFYKKVTKNHGFIYLHPASDSISFHRLKVSK